MNISKELLGKLAEIAELYLDVVESENYKFVEDAIDEAYELMGDL